MGGTLEVASTPGEGSRFWFDLDLPEAAAADDSGPLRRVVGVRGERRRLLVVDDNADNRQLLRDLLVPVGFEVEEAADAESGLARVAAAQPDAILLDLRMPGMSRLEATRRLRGSRYGARARRDLPSRRACSGTIARSASPPGPTTSSPNRSGSNGCSTSSASTSASSPSMTLEPAEATSRRAAYGGAPTTLVFPPPPSWHRSSSTPSGRHQAGPRARGADRGGDLRYGPFVSEAARARPEIPGEQALPVPRERAARIVSEGSERRPVILVVDDTPDNLGVLFDLLGRAGFEVLIAEDGESALRRVALARPDLILLDVVMPDMDGFATCERLKQDPVSW